MAWLSGLMQSGIAYIYDLTGSYGISIVLLTLILRIILLPLNLSQQRSTLKTQELQPQVNALQKKYKNDPQRLNQEIMQLWKDNKVNPLSGCLMVLIQFPFIIALFQALQAYEPLKSAVFLGMNLGVPNKTVLPIVAGVSQYLQFKVTPMSNDPNQKAMLYIFPVLIGWMAMRFPAALSLYWIVSNFAGIGERFLLAKAPTLKREAGGA